MLYCLHDLMIVYTINDSLKRIQSKTYALTGYIVIILTLKQSYATRKMNSDRFLPIKPHPMPFHLLFKMYFQLESSPLTSFLKRLVQADVILP